MLMELMLAMGASATATARPAERSFDFEGSRVAYSEQIDAKGVRHIKGRHGPGGQAFAFRITRDGRASGTVGTEPVSFRVGRGR